MRHRSAAIAVALAAVGLVAVATVSLVDRGSTDESTAPVLHPDPTADVQCTAESSTSTTLHPTPIALACESESPVPTPDPFSTEAAVRHEWGKPTSGDEFNYTGALDPRKWNVYDTGSRFDHGYKSPSAWKVNGGVAMVTGLPNGRTGGAAAKFGQQLYGKWEARMRTSARDPKYHPVLLLWPDAGRGETCPEIAYGEGTTVQSSSMRFFLHYGCGGVQTSASKPTDVTKWHNYAVKWTPTSVTGYLDGVRWFRDTTPSHIPRVSMHQTMQLDQFPLPGQTTKLTRMYVDWVRVYPHTP